MSQPTTGIFKSIRYRLSEQIPGKLFHAMTKSPLCSVVLARVVVGGRSHCGILPFDRRYGTVCEHFRFRG